jgi:hypothetical protein
MPRQDGEDDHGEPQEPAEEPAPPPGGTVPNGVRIGGSA